MQDVRHAVRVLARRPGFTAVIVATLALAIGANTAIFSLVHAVLLRPLPMPDAERLVSLWETSPKRGVPRISVTPAAYAAYRDRAGVFADLGASTSWLCSLTGDGEPESLVAYRFSGSFFSILGVPARLGRVIGPEDARPGGEDVVVLSDALWRRRFAADPGVLGRAITLDGRSHTVIGVMPPSFGHPPQVQLWAPLVLEGAEAANAEARYVRMVGRLKPGVSLEQASAAVAGVAAGLAAGNVETQAGYTARIQTIADNYTSDIRPALLVLLGAVGFVLLIAAANVGNLLLARAADRGREVAIRASLGASGRRLVRQFLVESTLLALLGGVGGVLLAFWGVDLLAGLFPKVVANLSIPHLEDVRVEAPVLGLALLLSLGTGLAFGLVPALHAARSASSAALREGTRGATEGRRQRRLRGALVVGEVALALILTTGAALMGRSFARLQAGQLGFEPEGAAIAHVILPDAAGGDGSGYTSDDRKRAFYDHVLSRLRETPGVESAGAATFLPLSGWSALRTFTLEGTAPPPADEPQVQPQSVDEGYFAAMHMPVVRGRGIAATDVATSAPVAVVNQAAARRFWPGADPVGRRIRVPGLEPDDPVQWREVVGVVGDVRHEGLAAEPAPELYVPYRQEPWPIVGFVVRPAPGHTLPPKVIAEAVWSFDPDQPVRGAMPYERLASDSIAVRRLSTLVLGAFALVAVLLAGLGLYGVIAHGVARRTREIGVRMAVGARAADVMLMVVGRGVRLAALGAAIGLAASLFLTRLLSSLLYGVSPTDPASFAGVVLFLLVVAVAASYVPARRAARVDPAVALRSE